MTKSSVIAMMLLIFSCQVIAQNTCTSLVETAITTVDQACADLGSNQTCYGNKLVTIEAKSDVNDLSFEEPGDIVDVSDINRLRLVSMDQSTHQWGIALMKIMSNLPDTVPGQNVQLVMFGDVEIDTTITSEPNDTQATGTLYNAPMQAFYFKSGIGVDGCAEAPDGMLIQTSKGSGKINVLVNEIQIELGSTAYMTATTELTTIYILEGRAVVKLADKSIPVPQGTFLSLPPNTIHSTIPLQVKPYDGESLQHLPLSLLEQDITIAPAWDGQPLAGTWQLTYDFPASECWDGLSSTEARSGTYEVDENYFSNWQPINDNVYVKHYDTQESGQQNFATTTYKVISPEYVEVTASDYYIRADGVRYDIPEYTYTLTYVLPETGQ